MAWATTRHQVPFGNVVSRISSVRQIPSLSDGFQVKWVLTTAAFGLASVIEFWESGGSRWAGLLCVADRDQYSTNAYASFTERPMLERRRLGCQVPRQPSLPRKSNNNRNNRQSV